MSPASRDEHPVHVIRDASYDERERVRAEVERAAAAFAHVLVVPAGATLDAASEHALLEALLADPMIGFAIPRSTAATRWTAAIPSLDALERARPLLRAMETPRFVPTASGGCVLVRDVLVAELTSTIAPVAGVDLEHASLRANELGYRVVVADDALLVRSAPAPSAELAGGALTRASHLYALEAASHVEPHVGRLASASGATTLLVDLSGFRLLHNGTTECTKEILGALTRADAPFALHLLCDDDVASYHRIAAIAPTATIHDPGTSEVFDVALRVGVPFEIAAVSRLADRARTNVYMALDAIAWDCLNVRPRQLDAVWRLVAETADGVLFNSDFTAELFLRRFPEARSTRTHVSPHSFDAADYGRAVGRSDEAGGPLLVVGNHFPHKDVKPTLARLLDALPDERFVVLGLEAEDERIRGIASGSLGPEAMDALYHEARAVIVPSHYEGFGFPIAHGLARGRPVYARDTGLNRDFLVRWSGPSGLHLYRSTDELVAMVRRGTKGQRDQGTKGPRDFEPWSWDRSGRDIAAFLEATHAAFDGTRCVRRLARIAQLDAIAEVAASRAGARTSVGALTAALKRLPGLRGLVRRLRGQ